MEIKVLTGLPITDILDVFNQSFSDYFIPFELSLDQLLTKMKADKTDLNISVGVFENNTLIAFILHGSAIVNGNLIVYNGGTGVVPTKRGMGLTHQMYRFALPILKAKGFNAIILEAITENIQAIKSYEKAGFTKTRSLACYKGIVHKKQLPIDIKIKELIDTPWMEMQRFWDIQPTWQNAIHVLNDNKDVTKTIGAFINDELIGYLVFNVANNRIHQISVAKNQRRKGIASMLLSNISNSDKTEVSVINVDESSIASNSFFKFLFSDIL